MLGITLLRDRLFQIVNKRRSKHPEHEMRRCEFETIPTIGADEPTRGKQTLPQKMHITQRTLLSCVPPATESNNQETMRSAPVQRQMRLEKAPMKRGVRRSVELTIKCWFAKARFLKIEPKILAYRSEKNSPTGGCCACLSFRKNTYPMPEPKE